MFLKKSGLFTVLMLALLIIGFTAPAMADGKPSPRTVQLKIQYGEKPITTRKFDILATHTLKTKEGKMAKVEMKDLDDDRGFRMEITTNIGSTNPELMILKIKAWEYRTVLVDGKNVRKFVKVLDQTSRVARGATLVATERAGVDRDIVFSITPYYNRTLTDKSGDVEIIE